MVLDTSLLNTQQYQVWIKSKVEQSRERSCALPYPRRSSYWKRSLQVELNYVHQLYFIIDESHEILLVGDKVSKVVSL